MWTSPARDRLSKSLRLACVDGPSNALKAGGRAFWTFPLQTNCQAPTRAIWGAEMYKFTRITERAFELSNSEVILICLYSDVNKKVLISKYRARNEESEQDFFMDASDCLAAVQAAASTLALSE
jgi:hypothetical protein